METLHLVPEACLRDIPRVDCNPALVGTLISADGRKVSLSDASSTAKDTAPHSLGVAGDIPYSDAFWSAVHGLPWAFTLNAVVVSGAALAIMCEWCISDASLTDDANMVLVQRSEGALVISAPSSSLPTSVALIKQAMARSHDHHHRMLVVWPLFTLRPPQKATDAPQRSMPLVAAVDATIARPSLQATLAALALSCVHAAHVSGAADATPIASLLPPDLIRALPATFFTLFAWLQSTCTSDGQFELRFDRSSRNVSLRPSTAPPIIPGPLIHAHMVALPAQHAPVPVAAAAGVKRPREGDSHVSEAVRGRPAQPVPPAMASGTLPAAGAASASSSGVALAIIIPYRLQPAQNRDLQLQRFADVMPDFLRRVLPPLSRFHIFVMEQSNDGYKFNRGKLLNAGFAIASSSEALARHGIAGPFNAFCFHDVDLLPKPALAHAYGMSPAARPVHIGAAWGHYKYDNYVGGIITMSAEHVRAINGFPNDFWGWGGEDDELYARLAAHKLLPVWKPDASLTGAIEDMEAKLIAERGGERAGTSVKAGGRSEWRSMWKNELRALHREFNHFEGLRTLAYDVTATRQMNGDTTVITLDLHGADDPCAEAERKAAPGETDGPAAIESFKARKRSAYEALRRSASASA